MTRDAFTGRALRVPYVRGGRSWEGFDCWGLVYRFYQDVLAIDLPVYDGRGYGDTEAANEELGDFYRRELAAEWRPVAKPREGDLAIFRVLGRPIHAGVALDERRFLHADERTGTAVELFASPFWRDRVEGVFRRG